MSSYWNVLKYCLEEQKIKGNKPEIPSIYSYKQGHNSKYRFAAYRKYNLNKNPETTGSIHLCTFNNTLRQVPDIFVLKTIKLNVLPNMAGTIYKGNYK